MIEVDFRAYLLGDFRAYLLGDFRAYLLGDFSIEQRKIIADVQSNIHKKYTKVFGFKPITADDIRKS